MIKEENSIDEVKEETLSDYGGPETTLKTRAFTLSWKALEEGN